MKKLCLVFGVLFLVTTGVRMAETQTLYIPTPIDKPVIRLDPALDSIISTNAKVEVVKRGFGFTEGTVWVQHGKEGYLLFTDIPANVINKMTPDGKVSVFLDRAGYVGPITGVEMESVGSINDNHKDRGEPGRRGPDPLYRQFVNIGADGLAVDLEGRVIVCTYAGRSMIRIEKDGKRTLLADRYEGKRFNGTNDVVVKKDGAIYFTDSYGGLRYGAKDPLKEVDNPAVFMIKDGRLTRVVDDMPSVNGLAFSPDEKYLYVNTGGSGNSIRRYEVQPDGTVKNGQLFFDLRKDPDKSFGYTDGMRVDSKGNVYPTGPGGIWIISPEGKHIGSIRIPEKTSNLTFGDADFKTLYAAGMTSIYKIRVLIPGIPCHSCSAPQ
jgi:gluconolactonase